MPIIPVDGASLHYLREGAGPAALLVHGAGVGGEGWRLQFDGLSHRYSMVAIDNRGIGASTVATPASVSIEAMARDALAVMDAEGLSRFHLAGHSLGGLIAQRVALLAPHRVKSLALMCTFVQGRQAARISPSLLLTAMRMWLGTRRMRRRAFLDVIMPRAYLRGKNRDELASRLAPLFGRDLADQPSIVMAQLRAASRYDGAAGWAQLAAIPTIVLSGVHDRISRRDNGQALATAVKAVRLIEFPNAGHGLPIQCAAEVNALLDGHWQAAE